MLLVCECNRVNNKTKQNHARSIVLICVLYVDRRRSFDSSLYWIDDIEIRSNSSWRQVSLSHIAIEILLLSSINGSLLYNKYIKQRNKTSQMDFLSLSLSLSFSFPPLWTPTEAECMFEWDICPRCLRWLTSSACNCCSCFVQQLDWAIFFFFCCFSASIFFIHSWLYIDRGVCSLRVDNRWWLWTIARCIGFNRRERERGKWCHVCVCV